MELAQYEIDIFSLCEKTPILSKNKNKPRFMATFIDVNVTEWPDIKKFRDEQLKYYEKRLYETNNIFLKVRYSDFLFEYGDKKIAKNKYEISQSLLTSLVYICEHYSEASNYDSVISRLVEVSLLMGNKKELKKAVELIYPKLMDLIIIKSTVAYMNFRNLQEKFYKLLSKDKIMEFQMS
ncbi:hypothetical protein [Staphylococcus epidermidis]|uniref:hypothetical protein n=1 Tax=Staphylococcus epidermidis TaxID=1282 RepID=UPI002175B6B4|nr:hypothetical protein [Staphylococcus epidermidis]